MEKIQNKLVRDNILDIIINDGKKPISRILDNEEYKYELKKKFNEELLELFEANNSNDIKSELSDILELLISYGNLNNISLNDIIAKADSKRLTNGSFNNKIFLEKVITNE